METRGITIEFYGKSIELEDTLKDINKGLKATKTELQDFRNQLKIDPKNLDALQGKMKALRQEQMLLTQKAEYFRKELSKLDESEIGGDKWINFEKNLKNTERQLQNVTKEIEKLDSQGVDNLVNDTGKVDDNLKKASDNALTFGDILKANVISDFVINGLKTLANELKSVASELNQWADSYRDAQVYEKQFENNIRNTADATDEEIDALKKLAKQKQRQGVISSRAITSAYQELATYVESTDAIEGLTNALVDMSAQQYGVDATEESVRNIATTLGKALANGDYSGLTRLGYGFDKTQQYIMKYGNELQRVAVLNEVIESSIGGMNEALAQTDAGKLFEVKSYFDDIKTSIGEVVSELEVGLVENVMPYIQPLIDDVLKWISENKDEIYQFIVDIIDYLTSEEMSKFFSDCAELVKDIIKIAEYVIKIGDEIGLWEGIFNAVKGVIQGIKELFDAIRADVEYISSHGIGSWAMGNYNSTDWGAGGNSWTPGWSGGYGSLNSGGYRSGGITLNASFNVNANNVTRADVEQWSGWLVDSINTKLGEAI